LYVTSSFKNGMTDKVKSLRDCQDTPTMLGQ
jgi:hypothetical protein